MKTRIIQTRFWDDEFVSSVDLYTQHLYIYLLTSQYINISGIFQLPERKIMFETKLTEIQFSTAKKLLEKEKKVLFFKGWVFVKNAKKDNNYTQSPKNQIAHDKEISLIPDEVRAYFDSSINSSIDSTIDTVSIVPINHKPEIINNKTETKERKKFSSIEDITAEVIAELAEKYKVRYQFAELNFEKMSNWLESSGKIKKNYKATLANFIIGDEKFEQEQKTYRSLHSTQNQTVNTTEKYELSPIEREKAQKRLDEIRSKFHTKGFDS